MRSANVLLAVLVLTLLSVSSHAGASFSGATIVSIQIAGVNAATGYAVIQLDATSSGPPACAAAPRNTMYVSMSTGQGRAALKAALAAMMSGRRVSVYGTGLCVTPSGLPSEELISRIQITNQT